MQGEGDADAVGAEGPVEGVEGGREVCEEGGAAGEGGKFGEGDWGEACVVKGAGLWDLLDDVLWKACTLSRMG